MRKDQETLNAEEEQAAVEAAAASDSSADETILTDEQEPAAGGETGEELEIGDEGEPEERRLPETVPYERFRTVNEKAKRAEKYEQLLADPDALKRYMALNGMMPDAPEPASAAPAVDEELEWEPDEGFISEAEQRSYRNSVIAKRMAEQGQATIQKTTFQQGVDRYNAAFDAIEAREGLGVTAKEKADSLATAIQIAQGNLNLSEAEIAERMYAMIAYPKLKESNTAAGKAKAEAEAKRLAALRQQKQGLAEGQVGATTGPVTTEPEQFDSIDDAVRTASRNFHRR